MTNTKKHTVTVQANPDADDCLAEAQREYIADHSDLRGWDLNPQFVDESSREWIVLTIPGWHWDAISDTSGT